MVDKKAERKANTCVARRHLILPFAELHLHLHLHLHLPTDARFYIYLNTCQERFQLFHRLVSGQWSVVRGPWSVVRGQMVLLFLLTWMFQIQHTVLVAHAAVDTRQPHLAYPIPSFYPCIHHPHQQGSGFH